MSEITRRDFLAGTAVAASGLVIACRSNIGPPVRFRDAGEATAFGAWIHITPDDRILLTVDKVEMGQGTLTGFATLVGEELEIEPARIEVAHAPVDDRFKDSMPLQSTGGSTSLVERWVSLRESAARARVALERAGAETWGVPLEDVAARDGVVTHASSGRGLTYGALAVAAAKIGAPRKVTLKSPESFRFIGRSSPRLDGFVKSTGRARYGIDTVVPGLLTAVVVRPPSAQDRVASFRADEARAVPGVVDVFEVPTGVAVVAKGYWAARKAAGLVQTEVERGDRTGTDSATIRAENERRLREGSGKTIRSEGNVEDALAGAVRTLDVEYFTPHQAHATMEPMNCTVVPGKEKVEVHLGTQAPGIVQDVVAGVMGRSRGDVVVHTAMLGGGFGRRFFPDVAAEAAEIAKRAEAPVRLVWSREDDMARDYYRPATGHRFRGGVDAEGRLVVWQHKLVAPSLLPHMVPGMGGVLGPAFMRGFMNGMADAGASLYVRMAGPVLAYEGAKHLPYAIPNMKVSSELYDPGIRVGIWRSVGHSNNGFVVEGFVDELAGLADRDPMSFRRELLEDHPRYLGVLDLLKEKSGWGRPRNGQGQGVAIHESFGTVVGQVAEVSVEEGQIRVDRVVCVVDCGRAINPEVVRVQIESGIIFGLTAAVKGEITFEDGVAVESNFDRYPMLRMSEAPAIEVYIVPSEADPTGIGEPGTPPIAAAVANAVNAATGVRLRELPLRLPVA